jgi:uncharacterized protein (DUF2384 family)
MEASMTAVALISGTRDEVAQVAQDPRIGEAETAIEQFGRTGAVRDAAAYARCCISLIQELLPQAFPGELRGEVLRAASIKALDACATRGDDRKGWLAWSLAHELRDLAASYDIQVDALRPPRGRPGEAHTRAGLNAGQVVTLAQELMRVADSTSALEEIQQVMGLSSADAAGLFGVTRQAVDQWRQNGVPADRVADVQRIRDVARALYEELIPERIPQVVRNPARGLGGRSILAVLGGPGGTETVRGYLARLYAFDSA